MTDHELKEKMMKELIEDLKQYTSFENMKDDIADCLIRAGWRKP